MGGQLEWWRIGKEMIETCCCDSGGKDEKRGSEQDMQKEWERWISCLMKAALRSDSLLGMWSRHLSRGMRCPNRCRHSQCVSGFSCWSETLLPQIQVCVSECESSKFREEICSWLHKLIPLPFICNLLSLTPQHLICLRWIQRRRVCFNGGKERGKTQSGSVIDS